MYVLHSVDFVDVEWLCVHVADDVWHFSVDVVDIVYSADVIQYVEDMLALVDSADVSDLIDVGYLLNFVDNISDDSVNVTHFVHVALHLEDILDL